MIWFTFISKSKINKCVQRIYCVRWQSNYELKMYIRSVGSYCILSTDWLKDEDVQTTKRISCWWFAIKPHSHTKTHVHVHIWVYFKIGWTAQSGEQLEILSQSIKNTNGGNGLYVGSTLQAMRQINTNIIHTQRDWFTKSLCTWSTVLWQVNDLIQWMTD